MNINDDKSKYVKEAIRMAWPAVLESFFVALASMIDTMMVASLGTAAVASVGLTTQPKFLCLAVFISSNIALSALVARRRGQLDRRNANETLLTALFFVFTACVLVTVASLIFADDVIRFCGSNPETHDGAVLYFRVIQGGMFFNVISLCINAAQRGSGNTKIAMTTNLTSSVINMVFNYLLIGGNLGFPKLGLFGAAFATVLGTVAAMVMSIRSLLIKDSFVSIPYMIKERIKPRMATLVSLLKLASNMLVENFALRVGFMYTAVAAAKLGTNAFAAHQVGMNFLSLGFSFGDGMQVAAVALIGKSLGEKKPEKAKMYGNICQLVGLAISVMLSILLFFGGRTLFSLFFEPGETLEMGVLLSRFIMIIVLFQISQIVFAGALRGAGDVKFCLFSSLISVTFIRTAVTWLCTSVLTYGLAGIWIGILSDQLSRFILLGNRFRQGNWVNFRI